MILCGQRGDIMVNFIEISIIYAAARCGIRVKDIDKVEIPVTCPFCGDDMEHASLNAIKNGNV